MTPVMFFSGFVSWADGGVADSRFAAEEVLNTIYILIAQPIRPDMRPYLIVKCCVLMAKLRLRKSNYNPQPRCGLLCFVF